MNAKRLLLVIDDPFLSRFYREKLAHSGYQVDLATDLPHALDLLQAEKPGVLVLDPLIPGSDAMQSIESLRESGATDGLNIIILPILHYVLSQRVEADTTLRLLKLSSNPLGELLQHLSRIAGKSERNEAALMLASLPDEEWKQAAVDAAQQSVGEMRHKLHDLARSVAYDRPLDGVLQHVHRLVGQAGFLSRGALTNISSALEIMVYNLAQFPDRIDPLALRTLSQAIDFISLLLQDSTYARVAELDSAHIMIIEDEASARELIIAAMELVGLQARGQETPHGGLSALGDKSYDLIFLDINLPEMNGFELCNKVRSLPLHERTPIVFLTGMASFSNRVQSNLSGGNDFIGKPFNVAELGVKALMWVMKGRLGLN